MSMLDGWSVRFQQLLQLSHHMLQRSNVVGPDYTPDAADGVTVEATVATSRTNLSNIDMDQCFLTPLF
jgi:hypothetical protein